MDPALEPDILDLLGDNDPDPEMTENEELAQEAKAQKYKTEVWYFDLETTFDDGYHRPNLAIAQIENGESEQVCYGENALEDFMCWISSYKTKFKRVFLCHNFGHFDGYPLLWYFYSRSLKVHILI